MKTIKNGFTIILIVVLLSFTAFAQTIPGPYYPPFSSNPKTAMRLDKNSLSSFTNIRIFSSLYNQTETAVAIDPNNLNNFFVGANTVIASNNSRIGGYYSTSGINTWNGVDSLSGEKRFDPSVSYDLNGNLYYAYILEANNLLDTYVMKSTDNGVNWGTPVKITPINHKADKSFLTTDRNINSSYKNNIYVVWTETQSISPKHVIFFSKSTNNGVTFSSPIIVSDLEDAQSAVCSVDKNGVIYLSWGIFSGSQTVGIGFSKSTDGGATFSVPTQIYSVNQIGAHLDQDTTQFYLKVTTNNPNGVRINSFPSMAVDPISGNLYIVWADSRFGSADIVLIKSTDGGGNWSTTPIKVNDDSGNTDQWFPWVNVGSDGGVNVAFYDSRNDQTANLLTEVFVARSIDGGQTFVNQKVSDMQFTPLPVPNLGTGYMGDYISITSSYNKVYPVWMDNRTGNYQIYTAEMILEPVTGIYTIDQTLSNGTRAGVISKWNNITSSFDTTFAPPKTFPFDLGSTQTLKGDQGIISNEKYNNWNNDPNVINHHSFIIDQNTATTLTSHFKATNSGITIENSFLEIPSLGSSIGNVKFQDPWLIDFADPQFADSLRNQGMSAPFKAKPSPFNPDYTTSFSGDVYKGLFLGQDPALTPTFYSVDSSPQDISLGGSIGTHKFYLQNWSGTGAAFQDSNSAQTAVVFNTGNAVAMANLKGTQLSNQTDAIAGNGQRKVVKTSNGNLHQVYESLGKIWYERSTDGGVTWEIMNGGKSVSGGTAKHPSIDYFNYAGGPVIAIAYQSNTTASVTVFVSIFKDGVLEGSSYGFPSYSVSQIDQANFNTTPVVSINSDGKILIVWYVNGEPIVAPSGLYYKYGYLYQYYGIIWMINWYFTSPIVMGNTSFFNSENPTLSNYKSAVQPFQLAYEKNNTIYYRTLTDNPRFTNHISVGTDQNISNGGGYTYNNNPSILAVNGGARVVWEGHKNGGFQLYSGIKKIVFHDPNNSYYWSFLYTGVGFDALSPNINQPDDHSAYYFGWSEGNTDFVLDNSLSFGNIKNLGINGQFVQVINGATPTDMFATTLNISSTPFYFTSSPNSIGSLFNGVPILMKSSTNTFAGIEGRKGVVFKDSAQFYFDINKIKVDGRYIRFTDINETEDITDKESLNQYLITEPFKLSNKSSLSYNINFGTTDTVNAEAVLGKDDFISFKLQLINDKTDKVIGEFDNVDYTKNKLFEYKNVNYKVDTKGIGNKTVRLKLIVNSNFKSGYALSMSSFGDGSANLGKESFKQIAYNQNLTPTNYELAQNYPNPFNPRTTINYQLPKAGVVTLTIYDVLGREVRTLVNEFKSEGNYSINFNAGQLASGVYFYRIKVNDFSSVKKLLLLK